MTHYPKAGKGKKWTIKELNSIPAEWKGHSISDGEGLSGEVRVSKNNDIRSYNAKTEVKLVYFK